MTGVRPINPTRVWVRHIARSTSDDPGAVAVIPGVWFAPMPLEGVGGRQGWQSGLRDQPLSDEAEITLTLPNSAGEDGILHRRRFAILTDPSYRPGEEWLEVWEDTSDLVAVFTPVTARLTRRELTLKGYDVAGYMSRFRAGLIDLWPAAAPRDVFEHYTRLPTQIAARDFRGTWTTAPEAGTGTDAGWSFQQINVVDADTPAFNNLNANGGVVYLRKTGIALPSEDCFVAQARVQLTQLANGENAWCGLEVLNAAGTHHVASVLVYPDGRAQVSCFALGGSSHRYGRWKQPTTGMLDLRVVVHYDRVFAFVGGELVASARRSVPYQPAGMVMVRNHNGTGASLGWQGEIHEISLDGLAPFALRGTDKGDLHLAGRPTPGGLRASYYNEAPTASRQPASDPEMLLDVLDPRAEPAVERLDATVDFTTGNPPNLPGAFSVRWQGAIYLDLSSARYLRLLNAAGACRVHVGKTRPGEALIESWVQTTGTRTSGDLREHLGTSRSGWYPLVIEFCRRAAGWGSGLRLEQATSPGGPWSTVPSSQLSPYGTFSDQVRLEPCKEMLTTIAEQFGLQFVGSPRSLESGEFPGQIIPRVREGVDRDVVICGDDVPELADEIDAGDAVDRLVADAAGLADIEGAEQLTAELTDFDTAGRHLGIVTDYESLADITETSMLTQRLGSLLALRATPNEQLGLLHPAQKDLADTLPLSGELGLMRWQPGDGVRRDLAELDVVDRGPAQIRRVQRTFVPSGVGPATLGFRVRPRDPAAVVRRALRTATIARRNYQGQLVERTGNVAASDSSYVPLPDDVSRVKRLVWITSAAGGAGWVLEVSGVNTGVDVTGLGPYDVTRWLRPDPGTQHVRARPVSGSDDAPIGFLIAYLDA